MDSLSDVLSSKDIIILVADALIAATLQLKIAGVGMSSSFSVQHYVNSQETLDHAVDALDNYIIVGIISAIALSSLYYRKNNTPGFIICLMSNLLIISWLYYSYNLAFDEVVKKYNLKLKKSLF